MIDFYHKKLKFRQQKTALVDGQPSYAKFTTLSYQE